MILFSLEASKYNPRGYGAYPTHDFHHANGAEGRDDLQFRTVSLDLPDTVDFARFQDRLGLQRLLDGQRKHLEEAAGGMDRYREMAVGLLSDPKVQGCF